MLFKACGKTWQSNEVFIFESEYIFSLEINTKINFHKF